MKNEKLAFGMNQEEFSKFYKKEEEFNKVKNTNHRMGISFIDFLDKGSKAIIKDHKEMIRQLK